MRFDIHFHIHIPEPGLEVLFAQNQRNISMISAEVQKILNQARESSSLVQSVHLGMQGLGKQVADLQAKIDSLPVGNVLGDDDKAALQEAASQLDSTINTLRSDIPANVDSGSKGADAPQTGDAGTGDGGGAAPQGDQSDAAQGSAGGARPLPGTGQS